MTDLPARLREYAALLERVEFRVTHAMRVATLVAMRDAAAELDRRVQARAGVCPFDLPDDPRADIDETEPCPVCGMTGEPGAEDRFISGPRARGGPRGVVR